MSAVAYNPQLARPRHYVLKRHKVLYNTDPPMVHTGITRTIPSGVDVWVLGWGKGRDKRAYVRAPFQGQDWFGWVDRDDLLKPGEKNPRRRSSGRVYDYAPVERYAVRFIRPDRENELVNLYHLARAPLSGTGKSGKYEQMLWASKEFHKAHPEIGETEAYKDLDGLLSNYFGGRRNPARSGKQYRMAQAVLSGASAGMPRYVAREIVDKTSAVDRSRYARGARRNPEPAAAGLYESFHGKPSESVIEIVETEHEHTWFATLGEMVELQFASLTKKDVCLYFNGQDGEKQSRVPQTDICYLASNEGGTQLFLVGGDQEVDLSSFGMDGDKWSSKELMVLGTAKVITYRTEKEFDDLKTVDYFHKLGEETKVAPMVLYDRVNQKIKLAGGQYQVKPEGLVN